MNTQQRILNAVFLGLFILVVMVASHKDEGHELAIAAHAEAIAGLTTATLTLNTRLDDAALISDGQLSVVLAVYDVATSTSAATRDLQGQFNALVDELDYLRLRVCRLEGAEGSETTP